MAKKKYYSLNNILKENATYNMVIGERSNGKTYAVLEYGIKDYCENGNQMALIRRYLEAFTGKRGSQMFEALINNGIIEKYSKGRFTTIVYRASRWWLAKRDENLDKMILDERPFCFAFSLNSTEHDKSSSYPKVKNILFDEFLTRQNYLNDEFILFMNTLSTIIRENDDVKIFMCANTVNKYCPYFIEMGLNRIEKQEQGTIDIYQYGESNLKVAVEYCSATQKGKKSDKYFAFDNPKLKMITNGTWEVAIYPHLPMKYMLEDVKLSYYIEFGESILQCDVVKKKDEKGRNVYFTYVHRKTTPLKDKKNDIIFSTRFNPKPNWFRRLGRPSSIIEHRLYAFFKKEKVFYQDNEIGEIMRNYLNWCVTDKIE